MSLSLRKARKQGGFTLIETLVSVVILTIGLVGVASLMSQTVTGTAKSRYMSTAAMLATEKLEDLNRYPTSDANVASGGSITGDVATYNDDVQISAGNGGISETTNGNTVTHKPDGSVLTTAGTTALGSDAMTFHRRWIVEVNPTINGTAVSGVRQITVLVTLMNQPGAAVTFQASMVRP